MVKIGISAALEKRMRAGENVLTEILALIDRTRNAAQPLQGMGYRELVATFKQFLDVQLALPPNPSTGWIVRQVNRAKELGLNAESIEAIVVAARRAYPRGPYDLEFLLRSATRLLADRGTAPVSRPSGTVHTGRPSDE